MIVPYRVYPDRHGAYLYSAVLPVQISLPAPNAPRTKRFEALIDSGATRCLFHANLATAIGLDLKAGEVEVLNGIGGPDTTWLHDITLHVFGGPIKIRAGFKDALPVTALLGMNGFFQHFNVTFEGAAQRCLIERIRIN
ncbi:MAG: aspartyl protease family protein [Terracidiphilus sp.]